MVWTVISRVEWRVGQSIFPIEPQVRHQLGWLTLNKLLKLNLKFEKDGGKLVEILFDWLGRLLLSFHQFQNAEGIGIGWHAGNVQGSRWVEDFPADWATH